MAETSALALLSMAHVLHLAAAVFVHEPSVVLIKPLVPREHSDFGFAMGYQTAINNLVVGAPSVDNQGKVYTCELDNAGDVEDIECSENHIELATVAEYSRVINPNQYFYTGSSIAAASDYLFTCAPLWTSIVIKNSGETMPDAFGTCFLLNETATYRYQGTLERFEKSTLKTNNLKSFTGGTGWSTLLDEENDLLLIVKTSLEGDFIYTPMSKPLMETKSLILTSRISALYLGNYGNIGYGITAGKFFSNRIVYAFSMETKGMTGAISFLEYNSIRNKLSLMSKDKPYKLESTIINTMFGSAMGAADLNMDGMDELLVGAPAHTEEDCLECGALHIYLGGEVKTIGQTKRLRTILGSKFLGRFGSAIAAKDIDGDNIPELVVSAPYEDDGLGTVYIMSGYDLYHTIIKFKTFKSIQVSDLKLTQKIQKATFSTLGFSLQFVNDADDNGCSELVAGSPGNGSALLLKCVQTINVTLSSELIGEQIVREQDKNFTVKVCARVDLHELPTDIVGNVSVTSSIYGEATYIRDPKFVFDISCFNCSRNRVFCENVIVFLNDEEPGDYRFTSTAKLDTDHIFNSKEFNKTWVVTSPHSRLETKIEVPRHCRGNDCIPKLSVEVFWPGNEDEYVLGSSSTETATILVENKGNASYEACVWVRVSGAPISRIDCTTENDGYKCYLPKPLRRDSQHSIKIVLDMTKPTNRGKGLQVEALLYENCNQRSLISGKGDIQISYYLSTDNISVIGMSHSQNVTDKQIMDSDIIYDDQEFLITNNGTITWKNIFATISMEKKPFIHAFKVTEMESANCKEEAIDGMIAYKCTLNLMPNSTQKVTTTSEILGKNIKDNLYEEKLNMTSNLQLFLLPTSEMKDANATTLMMFEKELTFANNKMLIAILAVLLAIIILAILIIILYKNGFFRRKQKQRLHVLRESIKRQNSRRTTHASEPKDANVEGLQIDVDDDCPFDDPIPVTTSDNAILVQEKAQVHC